MKKLNNILTIVLLIVAAYFAYDYGFNRKPKYDPSQIAPDFEAATPSGTTLRLSDYRGKIVLLDFWGSWCPPCRHENPALVALYQKYHGKRFKKATDFEILSVAMDRSKERWVGAIEQDGLVWQGHVSDLKRMGGKIGSLYHIREIPTKYLLNAEGVIVRVNPSLAELDEWLSGEVR